MKTRQGTKVPTQLAMGMAAVSVAGSASGAIVQVTNLNNFVSPQTGLMNFNADATGDGIADDLTGNFSYNYSFYYQARINIGTAGANVYARRSTSTGVIRIDNAGGGGTTQMSSTAPLFETALISFVFTDARINNGAATNGLLQVTASANPGVETRVSIARLIFDDASPTAPTVDINTTYDEFDPVPEPSSLALLALGAGGLITRRQRKKAG